MKLLPKVRKYFSYSYINNLLNPEKAKRPWLSMIRQLAKIKYNMVSSDYRIKQQGKKILEQNNMFLVKNNFYYVLQSSIFFHPP